MADPLDELLSIDLRTLALAKDKKRVEGQTARPDWRSFRNVRFRAIPSGKPVSEYLDSVTPEAAECANPCTFVAKRSARLSRFNHSIPDGIAH
jgi:hypothetical protein